MSQIEKEDILNLIGNTEEEIVKVDSIKIGQLKDIVKLSKKNHIYKLHQYYHKYKTKQYRDQLYKELDKLKQELIRKIDDKITIYLSYGENGDQIEKQKKGEEEIFEVEDEEKKDDKVEKQENKSAKKVDFNKFEITEDIEVDEIKSLKTQLDTFMLNKLLEIHEIFTYKVDIVNEDIDMLNMLNIKSKSEKGSQYEGKHYKRIKNVYDLLRKPEIDYDFDKYEDYLKGYYFTNKKNEAKIQEFYDFLYEQRKELIKSIKTNYYVYLNNIGFNAQDESQTYKFCLFQTENYKKYSFTTLLRTHYLYKYHSDDLKAKIQKGGAESDAEIEEDVENIVNPEIDGEEDEDINDDEEAKAEKIAKKAEKKEKREKWKRSMIINMMNYVDDRKDFMNDVLSIPNLKNDYKKYMEEFEKEFDIDVDNINVEHEHFYSFMNYYLEKHQEGTHYYQNAVEYFMSLHSYMSNSEIKSRGLLVNHGLGTGKTRTSMNVIKGCFYNYNKGWEEKNPEHLKKIFIFIPASLRYDPWTQHLTEPETRPFKTIETEYDLPLHNIFIVHYNGVNNITKFLNTVPNKVLDNSLILIDEMHNITNGLPEKEESQYGEYGKLYLELLNNKSNDMKIVCLTGTPILNYTMEYLFIMQIVKGKELFRNNVKDLYPEFFDESKDEQKSINEFFVKFNFIFENSQYFSEDAMMVREKIDTLTFEERESIEPYIKEHQYKPTETIEEFNEWKKELTLQISKTNSEDLIYIEKLKKLFSGLLSYYKGFDQSKINRQYLFIPLTGLQSSIVNEIKSQGELMFQDLNSQTRRMQRMYELQATKGLAKSMGGVVSGLAIQEAKDSDKRMRKSTLLREAENICYMKSKVSKYPLVKAPLDQIVSNKIEHGEDDHKFSHKNMLHYSHKLSSLMVNIHKNDGCHLVYCKYEDIYGIRAIEKMLRDVLGYEEYRSSQLIYNQEPRPRYAVYGRDNLLVKDFNKEYETIKGEEVYGPNKMGEYIKVLLITDKAKEGVNFKSIQYEHIINPWWNINIINQIIGRGIRINSHDYLKKAGLWSDDSKVTVYYYTSINKYFSTEDMKIGIISKRKYKANLNFYRTINSTAIDCQINQEKNNNVCIPFNQENIDKLSIDEYDDNDISHFIVQYKLNLSEFYNIILNEYSDDQPDKFQHIGMVQNNIIKGSSIKNFTSFKEKLRNLKSDDNPILIITCKDSNLESYITKKLVEVNYEKSTKRIPGSETEYVIYKITSQKEINFPAVEYTKYREKKKPDGSMVGVISYNIHNIEGVGPEVYVQRLTDYNLFFICGTDIIINNNIESKTINKILDRINSDRSKNFLYKNKVYLKENIIYHRTLPKGQTEYYTNTLKLFNNIEDLENTNFVILLNNFNEDLFFVDRQLKKKNKKVYEKVKQIVESSNYISDKKVEEIIKNVKKLDNFTFVLPNREDMNNIEFGDEYKTTVYENKYLFIKK